MFLTESMFNHHPQEVTVYPEKSGILWKSSLNQPNRSRQMAARPQPGSARGCNLGVTRQSFDVNWGFINTTEIEIMSVQKLFETESLYC